MREERQNPNPHSTRGLKKPAQLPIGDDYPVFPMFCTLWRTRISPSRLWAGVFVTDLAKGLLTRQKVRGTPG